MGSISNHRLPVSDLQDDRSALVLLPPLGTYSTAWDLKFNQYFISLLAEGFQRPWLQPVALSRAEGVGRGRPVTCGYWTLLSLPGCTIGLDDPQVLHISDRGTFSPRSSLTRLRSQANKAVYRNRGIWRIFTKAERASLECSNREEAYVFGGWVNVNETNFPYPCSLHQRNEREKK